MGALKDCIELKEGEKFLVVTDQARYTVGEAFFEAALKLGAKPLMVIMPAVPPSGREPPDPIPRMMKEADAVVAPTTYSISHTQARRNAAKAGSRIATMPTMTEKMMSKGGMTADFKQVERTAKKLHTILKKYTACRVTTKLGSDVTFEIPNDKWNLDTGMINVPHEFGNLPGGEVFLPPAKANGTLVVDGAFAGVGILDEPVTLEMKDNFVTQITGGKAARKIKKIVTGASKEMKKPRLAFNVAEFGIGINPKAKLIGNALEDEKAIGTIHMAIGDNSTFGGNIVAPVHLDGIVKKPTITLGQKKVLMKDGKFAVKL